MQSWVCLWCLYTVSHACCGKKIGPDTQTKLHVNDSLRRAAHRNLSLHASCILSRLVSVNASQKHYRRLLVKCWTGENALDASAPSSTCRCNMSEQVHVSEPQVTGEAAPARCGTRISILDEPKSFSWALWLHMLVLFAFLWQFPVTDGKDWVHAVVYYDTFLWGNVSLKSCKKCT